MSVNFDYQRPERLGMPEAVLCEGKSFQHIQDILSELSERNDYPVLFTRLEQSQFEQLPESLRQRLDYDELSRTAVLNGQLPKRWGKVAVVTAGTSDLSVATEAVRTLTFSGVETSLVADVGVAGIWRLMERVKDIAEHDLIIVVAGMDAALASVMGGLVGKCVIGVPTSVGYGVAADGTTALNSMLASCGQGIVVTNIDNGFGGACAALRILSMADSVFYREDG
ncbi:nickel pincer cofactor biosynthesis protein LarB [Maricurvus nonylphenolicus]|uniref:nickel pincer cofactor biosynthesis protein LarB n=1 Tax=Maricurvus nonylphenolicus TaxID=1008307 RepID=UPI0036F3322E